MARRRPNTVCLFSPLERPLRRLGATPREEAQSALGERPEAGGHQLVRSDSRANSKLSAFPDFRRMAVGVGKEGKVGVPVG